MNTVDAAAAITALANIVAIAEQAVIIVSPCPCPGTPHLSLDHSLSRQASATAESHGLRKINWWNSF